MSKIQASAFKNAYPNIRKDLLVNGIMVENSQTSLGPFISCSRNWICYNRTENSIGVMPMSVKGRFDHPLSINHAGFVSGIKFSPFDPDLLASCSQEGDMKVHKISEGSSSTPNASVVSTCQLDDKIEKISFHPSVKELLSCVGSRGIYTYDYVTASAKDGLMWETSDTISLDWNADGRRLLCTRKNGEILIIDPRKLADMTKHESSLSESKALWIGENGYILQSGYNRRARQNQVLLYDSRNLSAALSTQTVSEYKQSAHIVCDQEKNIFVATTKGSQKLFFGEVVENASHNPLEFYQTVMMEDNIVGVCEVPRDCLDIMNYEVMRCIVLTTSAIRPLSFTVTRPNKMDFASHLFPPIFSSTSELCSKEWLKDGKDFMREKVSLDPGTSTLKSASSKSTNSIPVIVEGETPQDGTTRQQRIDDPNTSRFKYINIKEHPKRTITGLGMLEKKTPVNCDGAQLHKRLLAVPLSGSGGRVGIIDTSQGGKLSDSGPFFFETGDNIRDLSMDSGERLLSLLSDDGSVKIWKLPSDGSITKNSARSDVKLQGSQPSVSVVKLNNSVENILATGCNSGSVHVWDISSSKEAIKMKSEDDSCIISLGWNNVGSHIVTLSGRKYVDLYDPRNSTSRVCRMDAFSQTTQGRVNWIEQHQVIATGFSEGSRSVLLLYDIRNPAKAMFRLTYGSEVSALIPFYDEDTRLIHMHNKGSSRIRTVEVRRDSNSLLQCIDCLTHHQYMTSAFFRKDVVDVRGVELTRCAHIYSDSVSISSISIARSRGEFFQDDIYPPTRETWKWTMNSAQWLSNKTVNFEDLPRASLKPSDMQNLSDQPALSKSSKYNSKDELTKVSEKNRAGLLKSDMIEKIKEMADDFAEDDDFGDSTRTTVADETEWDG